MPGSPLRALAAELLHWRWTHHVPASPAPPQEQIRLESQDKRHVPFRSKTRLNSSLPFSFKLQVYKAVSGRSRDPCPPPPRAKPGADRTVAVLESSALPLQTLAFHCLLTSTLFLLSLPWAPLYKREQVGLAKGKPWGEKTPNHKQASPPQQ